MGFKCGIVGLPNVGKSTIFNAVTATQAAQAANYPFCTIDPNVGRVDIPDPRLDELHRLVKTIKVIPAVMEFVDIAGLVRGASEGEGLGNQFLGHIRETNAIAHVVRCFDDSDITHVDGSIDPLRDTQTIDTELVFADMGSVEKAVVRYQKQLKTGDKKVIAVCKMLDALTAHLQGLKPARTFPIGDFISDMTEVSDAYHDLHLITGKTVVYVCNVGEDLATGKVDNKYTKIVKEIAAREGNRTVMICGKLEEELSQLDKESRTAMIHDYGMEEPGLDRLIRCGYEALGLMTYFTAGEKEIRAWTIHRGDKAPQAAGKIHSDFERGFICAEVYTIPDLRKALTKPKLKELGLIRQEGREYIVVDGDVMEFRFNV